MLKATDILRSRVPVLAAVAAIAFLLIIGSHGHRDLQHAWESLHIPALSPLFADTRTITHSIDCTLAGQDPYTVRSFDPWHRLYNYPPIWLKAHYLGVTSRTSNLIGTLLALFTIAASLCLFRSKNWKSACIIFFALTSQAVLFAVERGNTDQVIFALLVFGIFLIDRQRTQLQSIFHALLIVLLTVLKIYPVVAVVIFLRSRHGIAKALLTATASIAALVLTSGHSLAILLANTPRDSYLSFGSFPFFMRIGRHFPSYENFVTLHHAAAPLGAIFLGILTLRAAYLFRHRLDDFLLPLNFDQARGLLAICGVAIFCFAFITGSSYDYRLLFLLGPLAYLVEDINRNSFQRSLLPAILILLLMWGSFQNTVIHEITDGLVYILAVAWLGSSLFFPSAQRRHNTLYTTPAFQSH